MAPPVIPRWQVAALLVVVVAASAGVLGYSATHPLTATPYCATDPGAAECPPTNGNITYASEDVVIPFDASGPINVTNVSFLGVEFHVWPYDLPPPIFFLQGVTTGPIGVNETFVVSPHGSWYSPDGVFGVAWFSGTNDTIDARLSVADPAIVYAVDNLTPLWPDNGGSAPATVELGGVVFTWHTWSAPLSGGIEATATFRNGMQVSLELTQGQPLLIACTGGPSAIHAVLVNSSCLEDGNPALGVAMAWTIDVSTHTAYNLLTLMVRVG
jgi:hypothetical protein